MGQRHKMPEDAAALKAQLAAAEAELQQHRDEKEQFQKELETAQKEKEEADLKLGYLNKIGLTEEEFQEKKSSATGKIEVKLDELRGRKIALDRALEQSPLLSKQVSDTFYHFDWLLLCYGYHRCDRLYRAPLSVFQLCATLRTERVGNSVLMQIISGSMMMQKDIQE